jgi:hypothetical protein
MKTFLIFTAEKTSFRKGDIVELPDGKTTILVDKREAGKYDELTIYPWSSSKYQFVRFCKYWWIRIRYKLGF